MKLNTILIALLAALALVPLVAGCSPLASAASGTEAPANLDGTSWTLIRLLGKDLIPDTKATLTFEGDQIGGTASCNHYFGGVTIEDDSITVGMVGSTEMWCGEPEGLMDQETDYLKALGTVARYSVENDELTLFDASDQAVLVFAPNAD
jgi:heat shock protein HslJ